MQNLLEIQNALRSAPDQQLMALMQGANPTVPQWAVASELNNRKEMRDEQTRQQGLGQPTVLAQLTGAAPAPTPQTNVAGMSQGVASGMAQSMAPKTNVNQNTGIASVAPVATMASGGILKMGLGGDLDAQFILTDIPELGIRVGQFVKVSAETLEGLNNTLPEVMAKHGDKVASVQSYIDDGYRGLASAAREGDALIPIRVKKYVESNSPAPEVAAPVEVPAAITNFSPMGIPVDSPTLSPETMALAPTSPQGVEVLDIAKDARPVTNTLKRMSTPVGLATLGAAGDADMLDETIGVQTAPSMPASPGIAAGTPFDTTKYTPRLSETPAKAIQTGVDDKGRGIFIPSLEETQLDNLRGRSGVGAFSKVPFNATSDEAAKESVSQATLANNARDERVARVTSDGPGTELAETVGRIAPKADEPQQLRFINDILNRDTDEVAPASNAQLEAFTDATALRNTALTVPTKLKKPEVLEADDLQAKAVADVAKVTANENYPVSPVEVRKRLRAMEEKDADADERFDLAEARLDAERAAGLTAGEDAFVAPSKKEPFVPPYGSKFAENSAFLNDEAGYDGSSMDGLNTDGPFMPKEDTRITRMKVLADQISSGKLTPTALEFAKKDLERLGAAVKRTGGQDTIEKYFSNQIIGPALRGAEKYGVKGIDFAVNELGLGSLASQAVNPEFAGRISDYTRKNAELADSMQTAANTSSAEIQSDAILDAMITNDAQIKAGSAAKVDDSLGALITDGKAQIKAVPGPLLTPELNDKLAAELETVVQDRKKEISEDGALINKMWGESEFQPETNVESQIVNAEGLTAAEQLDADRAAGLTAGENAFVASTKQDAGGSGKGKSTGIATINPMANRPSDSPSSYEQKLLDILAEREKSADQDKWLGLAEMGMRLMASSNPNMLSAIGEAGLGASQTFLGNKRKAEAQEMDILTKLSALESRKQIADDANRTRLTAAGISAGAKSGKPAAGSYASVNTALTGIRAQISAIEGNMPAQPPTESRALDAYNTQIATLRSLREQEQQLMATNPVVASIFANVDGANAPAAVNLSK